MEKIDVRVNGNLASGGDTISSQVLELPLDLSISDFPHYLSDNHGFVLGSGIALHGQSIAIPRTTYSTPADPIIVVTGPSYSTASRTGLRINEDETLISFFNKVYPKTLKTTIQKDQICINDGELGISFQRTIRVPDNGRTHNLPPGLGRFPVHSIQRYAHALPDDTVEKGGVFIAMYQREAMWIRFAATEPFALKIYLGGVNGISGEPMVPNVATYLKRQNQARRKQDYLIIPGQPWLDGIATSPGKVKQFIATPYGSGYSVEQQITGEEKVGGLQFEVIPVFSKPAFVSKSWPLNEMGTGLDILATPRELGLLPGETLYMKRRDQPGVRPMVLRDLVADRGQTGPHMLDVDVFQVFRGRLEISGEGIPRTIVIQADSSMSFQSIGAEVARLTGLPVDRRSLSLDDTIVTSWENIRDLSPNPFSLTQTTARLRWSYGVTFQVTIKPLMGTGFMIDCSPSDMVSGIQSRIQAEIGIPLSRQLLMCGHRVLESSKVLSHYNISSVCTIDVLVRRPRAGSLTSSHTSDPTWFQSPRDIGWGGSGAVIVRMATGNESIISCNVSDTTELIKSRIQENGGIPPDQQFSLHTRTLLEDEKTLAHYGIGRGDTLHLVLRLRGGGPQAETHMMSVGAGGTVKQSISEDKNDFRLWNTDGAKLINVQIVNSARFEEITGLIMPPTPVSLETYAAQGLPFFDIYNEEASSVSGDFSRVRTVSEIDAERALQGNRVYDPREVQVCCSCHNRLRDCVVRPCNHCICRHCAESMSAASSNKRCLAVNCSKPFARIVGISAPMNARGHGNVEYEIPVIMLDVKDTRERFTSILESQE